MGEAAQAVEARSWNLWSWEALRYRGSGWWLDRALPRSPLGVVIVALALVPLVTTALKVRKMIGG